MYNTLMFEILIGHFFEGEIRFDKVFKVEWKTRSFKGQYIDTKLKYLTFHLFLSFLRLKYTLLLPSLPSFKAPFPNQESWL